MNTVSNQKYSFKVLLAVCIVGAMATEEKQETVEQPAVAVESEGKDLQTAEGHLGAYGYRGLGYGGLGYGGLGYGGLGYGTGYGLYGAGYGGLGYGYGAGYGGAQSFKN